LSHSYWHGGLGTDATKEFSSTKIATINATGVTGTEAVNVFAINNTVAMTVTGPASTGTFTLDTGSGADTITAGSGILDVDAGAGDDTITGGALADVLEGDAGNDTITGGEGADYIEGGLGVDTITLTETTAIADVVELSVGAANYDNIVGFDFGGTTTDDNLSALQATFLWNSTGGVTTVLLSTGTTLGAADGVADSNIITISTNVAGGTFASFMAGTMTEATMEANVITALGLTAERVNDFEAVAFGL
jgi:Ca2+-binding RTX toxin-like protein